MICLPPLVKSVGQSLAQSPVKRENELHLSISRCIADDGIRTWFAHPHIKEVTRRFRRQGCRSSADLVRVRHDGDPQWVIEAKLIKRRRYSFYASEIARDLCRLELFQLSDYIAFGFESILVLAGDRDIMRCLWAKNATVRVLLPDPFASCCNLPFNVNLYAMYRRFDFNRLEDPLRDTWSYFSRARIWKRTSIADFGDLVPLPKRLSIIGFDSFSLGQISVCAFRLGDASFGPWDEKQRNEWLASRFTVA